MIGIKSLDYLLPRNLGGAYLNEANLNGANLISADLGGADLGGANLVVPTLEPN